MNCLITGAGGVIGKYLLEFLLKSRLFNSITTTTTKSIFTYRDGKQTYYCDGNWNLLNKRNVAELLDISQPDYVFNLAGISSSSYADKKLLWETNTTTLINLLEELPKDVTTKIVHMSSTTITNTPFNLYAASKLCSEKILLSYQETYGNIEWLAFRPCAVVGASNKHGLLKDIIAKVKQPGPLELWGVEPGSCKPYIYAAELANFIIDRTFGEYQASRRNCFVDALPIDNLYVRDVANIVMKELGITKDITWNPSKVWTEDQNIIIPQIRNFCGEHSSRFSLSERAIKLAVADIIEEQQNAF